MFETCVVVSAQSLIQIPHEHLSCNATEAKFFLNEWAELDVTVLYLADIRDFVGLRISGATAKKYKCWILRGTGTVLNFVSGTVPTSCSSGSMYSPMLFLLVASLQLLQAWSASVKEGERVTLMICRKFHCDRQAYFR